MSHAKEYYPITSKFEQELDKLTLTEQGSQIAARMITHIGEYEHGGLAEASVLFPDEVNVVVGKVYCTEREREYPEDKTPDDLALETMSEMFLDLLMTYWVK